jgi:hypothetical protein
MPAHRDGADDKGKTIAVALLADFSFDGDPLGEGRQSDFFSDLLLLKPVIRRSRVRLRLNDNEQVFGRRAQITHSRGA